MGSRRGRWDRGGGRRGGRRHLIARDARPVRAAGGRHPEGTQQWREHGLGDDLGAALVEVGPVEVDGVEGDAEQGAAEIDGGRGELLTYQAAGVPSSVLWMNGCQKNKGRAPARSARPSDSARPRS